MTQGRNPLRQKSCTFHGNQDKQWVKMHGEKKTQNWRQLHFSTNNFFWKEECKSTSRKGFDSFGRLRLAERGKNRYFIYLVNHISKPFYSKWGKLAVKKQMEFYAFPIPKHTHKLRSYYCLPRFGVRASALIEMLILLERTILEVCLLVWSLSARPPYRYVRKSATLNEVGRPKRIFIPQTTFWELFSG